MTGSGRAMFGGPGPRDGVDLTVESTQAPETSTAGCATARCERYYPPAVPKHPAMGECVADDPESVQAPRSRRRRRAADDAAIEAPTAGPIVTPDDTPLPTF